MKYIRRLIDEYIMAKSENESLRYENRLIEVTLSPILLLVAVLNFVCYAIFIADYLADGLFNSVVYAAFAAILFFVTNKLKTERMKAIFIILIFAALLIFTVLRYFTIIGPAVWTMTFILVIFAMARNDMLAITVVALVLFGLGIYTMLSNQTFVPSTLYYVTQFVMFGMLFTVTSGVQAINQEKLRRIKKSLSDSDLIQKISSDFISVSAENIDVKIKKMLRRIGRHDMVDRSLILLLSDDQELLCYAYEWNAPGIKPLMGKVPEISCSNDLWWREQIVNKSIWAIDNVDMLEPEVTAGKAALQALGVKSFISAPIVQNEKVYGFLIFDCIGTYRKWNQENRKILQVMSNFLGDAFYKVQAENDINRMAYYDVLTGLPNRYLFNKQLDEAISEAEGSGRHIAVIFVDLDSFKSINETMGHEGGDELLVQVARSLGERLGDRGLVARFGGDEFTIMVKQAGDRQDFCEAASLIMKIFSAPVRVGKQEFYITASAGVAVYPQDGKDSNTLKKNADLAMYTAKELGKNQVAFCTDALKESVERRVKLTNMLYRAQENNELILYYQPLVDIATERIIGVEALIRWRHPELGMISPCMFIPLAEQSGLINPIGKWVLETACRQNKAWQDSGLPPIRMAINLSLVQFYSPGLVETIQSILADSGLMPEYLDLEITESIAIRETDYIISILQELKALGISISIDDFGTEYSSLARIKQLPIDRIKMAMEFVHGISASEKDEAIVRVIINLAENLGLKVIAEGVENASQFEFLKSKGCAQVQGFYFHKPMPAEEIEKLLRL